jgi:hypothetical protein
MKQKIILWGYPHLTHTHSYIYYGMKRAFEKLGYEVHWFHDGSYPSKTDFDYENCIFFVDNQGRSENNVPILETGVYFSYDTFTNLNKYLGKVKGLVNYRVAEYKHPTPDGERYIEIEKGVVFDNQSTEEYNVVHFHYATNLLPNEINLDWANKKRNNEYNFVGTIHSPRPNSDPLHQDFIEIIKKNNIDFNHRDPWSNPATEQEHLELMQRSIFVPDFRPLEQKMNLYTSDRIMKAISYGCLVISDCLYAKNFINNQLLISENAQEIYDLGMKNQYNTDLIVYLMEVVKRDHTYINRCKGLLSIVEEFN